MTTWLNSAVTNPDGLPSDQASRSEIFEAVRPDRDSPVARRLLALSSHPRAWVRLAVLGILADLSSDSLSADYPDAWQAAAETAPTRLRDDDDRVRRAAAWLLAAAGGTKPVVRALEERQPPLDPVARVSLVEALFSGYFGARDEPDPGVTELLRRDPDPAVRLATSLGALSGASPERTTRLNQAIRADLAAGADRLRGEGGVLRGRVGSSWGWRLAEDECCVQAGELLDPAGPPAARRTGFDLAEAAMCRWRAAPARLAAACSESLGAGSPEFRRLAVETLRASLLASRTAADSLSEHLDDPEIGTTALLALAGAGDERALPGLCAILDRGMLPPRIAEVLTDFATGEADIGPVVASARALLRRHQERGADPILVWPVVQGLAAMGGRAAPAAPELLHLLRTGLESHPRSSSGPFTRALGAIGPAAAAAVPLLESLAAGRGRGLEEYALLRITGDRRYGDGYLAEQPTEFRRSRNYGPEILTWLAEHGGLTGRQATQLWSLARGEGRQASVGAALWHHAGHDALPHLLEILPQVVGDFFAGPDAVAGLVAMGAAARPALPYLDSVIGSRVRMPIYERDLKYAMRVDERRLAAIVRARERITAHPMRSPAGEGRQVRVCPSD